MPHEYPVGKYREVGIRSVPEDYIYPVNTPEALRRYLQRLKVFEARNAALCPVIRVLESGEPRVRHFRTLEEANADWEAGKRRLVQWLNQARNKP